MANIKDLINNFDWFEYFRKIVKERNLKQNVLAEYSGISGGYLSGILTGKQEHELTRIPLILIADYLGMSLNKLMTGKEYEHPVVSQIKDILKQSEKEQILIEDEDIKEIIILLGQKRKSQMGIYESIKKLLKIDEDINQEAIDAMNVVIDGFINSLLQKSGGK